MARKKSSGKTSGKGTQEAIERYRTKTTRRGRQRIILFVAVILIAGILITYAYVASLPPYPARTPPLGSISVGLTGSASHIHAHLDIYLDGRSIPVPGNFGHLGNGFYALHAHDPDGVIHIEPATLGQTFTLGQIFEVWGWPLDSTHIFDKTGQVTMYVKSTTPFTPFDVNYQLKCLDEIVLTYGTPPATIPTSYDFKPGSCA